MTQAKSMLFWVGGKGRLLDEVFDRFPSSFRNYYEPFLGGGSVLIRLLEDLEEGKISVEGEISANDKCDAVISVFEVVKKHPQELIENLHILKHIFQEKTKTLEEKKERYFQFQRLYNELQKAKDSEKILATALYIMMNKLCYRGIHRETTNGEFRSGFCGKRNPRFFSKSNIYRLCYLFNKYNVTFYALDYKAYLSCRDISAEDFMYLDPPYYENEYKYNKPGFSKEKSMELFECLEDVPRFLLSNSCHPKVLERFASLKVSCFYLHRCIKEVEKKEDNEALILK